ncbi:MAG: hypothetical protein RBS56_00940 [Candidatus Gracilibacteria bacterium]|jgi:antitoxin component of RelBE/YafQ-DinJ toxin-antitoxin module|nr:hypothetical protein [Candidatus Gracilibacteria bacterium]
MSQLLTSLSLDKNIKTKAEKKAKEISMTLSGVMRILLNDFAEGKIRIGTIIQDKDENGLSLSEQRELHQALKDIASGESLSGPYSSAREFLNSLKKDENTSTPPLRKKISKTK